MTLPKRISRKSGRTERLRCPAHLKWVRGHSCCACAADRNIEAAHVRAGTDGAMSVKPSDVWAISLCNPCHAEQHRIGEPEFEKRHKIDMKALAQEFAQRSPALRKMRQP